MNGTEKTGIEIIEMLQLRLNKNGRVNTTWGDKTPLGLALVLRRLLENTTLTELETK